MTTTIINASEVAMPTGNAEKLKDYVEGNYPDKNVYLLILDSGDTIDMAFKAGQEIIDDIGSAEIVVFGMPKGNEVTVVPYMEMRR